MFIHKKPGQKDFVSAGFCRGNSVGSEQQRRAAMSCEGCSVKFTVFKRRRQCSICQHNYCSHCLPLGQNGGSNSTSSVLARFTDKKVKCRKCEVLTARPLIRSQLRQLKAKDLQFYLTSQQVSTRGCVEKDDLVNLLIRHAGNTSINSQRSDFHGSRSGHSGMQAGDRPSTMQDQPAGYYFPSTSETSRSSDYSSSRVVSNERTTAAGSGAEEAAAVSSSIPDHQATATTSSSVSHDYTCHISTSSSSTSSTPSNREWFGERSPTNVDIVELTDWAGDTSNSDSGPEPTITIVEDESPRRAVSEGTGVVVSEVPETTSTAEPATESNEPIDISVDEDMEVDELVEVVTENSEDDFEMIGDEPTDTVATTEPIITTQACTGITLASIGSVEDLEKLTVKQLKELLSLNRVDYRGCCEKPELVERVTRLWQDNTQIRKGLDTMSMDELCKICMDAPVECVMLECGHMATCTACGKQLSECPICRQFVIRIVRIFRA